MGDVKYHLGTYAVRNFRGKLVHMNLAANPSHLEAVNSVVVGKTRAKQFFINDKEMKRVMAVLLHGDAAFSGQVTPLVPTFLSLVDGLFLFLFSSLHIFPGHPPP